MGLTALYQVRSPHIAEVKSEWRNISTAPLNVHDVDRNNLTFTIFYSVYSQ